jgi:BON domain
MRTVLFTCSVVSVLLTAGVAWSGDTKAGTTPARPRETAPKVVASRGPARTALTDSQLETAIRARFAKSKINEDKFQVHVQGGVATIEGRTEVIQHKGVATRMAKSAGAVAVNNKVQASAAAKEKAASNLAEGRRRAQIKRGDSRSDAATPRQGK